MDASQRRAYLVLACASLGSFLVILNGAIVAVALPTLARAFDTDLGGVQWAVLAYSLTICCLLFPSGRLIDVIGARPIYLLGALTLVLSSALGASVSAFWQLAFLRGLQGAGAALLMGSAAATVTSAFQDDKLGQALGLLQTAVALGGFVSPTIGGLLIDLFGWRSIFWLSAGLSSIGFGLGLLGIQRSSGRRPEAVDWPGAAVLALALAALLTALARAPSEHSPISPSGGLVLAAVGLFGGFIAIERRTARPLIDPALLRIPPFVAGNLSALLAFVGTYVAYLLVPFFLQQGLGYSATQAGLILVAFPGSIALLSPVAGRLADRFGPSAISVIGMALSVLGLFWLSRLSTASGPFEPLVGMLLLGISRGLYQAPNNSLIMRSVPPERLGIASGFLAATIYFAVSLAAPIASGVFQLRQQVHLQSLPAGRSDLALAGGFDDTLLVAAAICALGLAVLIAYHLTARPRTAPRAT